MHDEKAPEPGQEQLEQPVLMAKKILGQYLRAAEAEQEAREDLQETRSRMTSIRGARLETAFVRGGGEGHFLDREIIRLEQEECRLLEKIKQCQLARRRVKYRIEQVRSVRLRRVLKLRYVTGMDWQSIAAAMKCDEVRTIYKWHGKALDCVAAQILYVDESGGRPNH